MIASGPGGSLPSARPVADAQGQSGATRAIPSPASAAPGELRPALGAETLRAIDPARQTSATSTLPRDETNERANLRRDLVEPARYAPAMLASETPTEATPAGPPPTFDLSILEKTRAVARAAPPVIPPPPERSSGGEPVDRPREAEAVSSQGRVPGEPLPDAQRRGSGPRSEAARPAAAETAERPEPTARDTSAKVADETAALVPARPDSETMRT